MSCLRYLTLEAGFNGKLSNSIVKLKHLETLDFGNGIIIIPSGVWKSKQLRHLWCEGFYQTHGCFSISPKMYSLAPNNLQTLMWIEDKFFELRLLRGLSKLRKLGIREVSNSTIKILSAFNPVPNALEVLKLSSRGDISEQINLSSYPNIVKFGFYYRLRGVHNFSTFPPNLVKRTLSRVRIDSHLLSMLRKLSKLRILKMVQCSYNEGKIDLSCEANGDGFLQLEVLRIEDPFDLSEVRCRDDVSMPKLKKLILVQVSEWPILRLPERLTKLTYNFKV